MTNWWQGATPRTSIQQGRVDESLFAANLALAVEGKGPAEYHDAETFFRRTYLTQGLKDLLQDVVRILADTNGGNPVLELQTGFGGGKTHAELAVYHLLKSPKESLRVPQLAEALRGAGLPDPPSARVAVLAGADLNPLGRTTLEGLKIRTLWGEMAYQLGAPDRSQELFAMVAESDQQLIAPGIAKLREVVQAAGPSVVLLDETLHYVDKAKSIVGAKGDLATNTVAFLRELTEAVATAGRSALVISLTASRMDMLSPDALDSLASMKHHVTREAKQRAPTTGGEVHEIVRRRLFEQVDEGIAARVAQDYRGLYASLGLGSQYSGDRYEDSIRRAYPFHPELVTVLYEQWGTKPSFQLTRGTLRFLALALQELWRNRGDRSPDLIQLGDVPLDEPQLRAMTKEVAGDPAWESVLGSDIAAGRSLVGGQPAKAQLYDQQRGGGKRQAQRLATTVLMHSVGGGENPGVTQEGVRVGCARPGGSVAEWDDTLRWLGQNLFYFYTEGARSRFRIEPNVISLHQSYRSDPHQAGEVEAHIRKQVLERALGASGEQFSHVIYAPESGDLVTDDDELKLLVMDFDHCVAGEELPPPVSQALLQILERRGQTFRQNLNTIVFALADLTLARTAREAVADYLAWQRIQRSTADWDRIGGAQQQLVKDNLESKGGTVRKALIDAYAWAAVPVEERGADRSSRKLGLRLVRMGAYGPGKLVAPMVWERLSGGDAGGQEILTGLTPDTLLERYGVRAWPDGEPWVTTRQLWDRFTQQVGLPMLSRREVLLDTLRLGQREGKFAIGHLHDETADRSSRDSYASLFLKDMAMPGNVPELGQRWLLLRPSMYDQITSQPTKVQPAEVVQGIRDLGGEVAPVTVKALKALIVERIKPAHLDEGSFHQSLDLAVREGGAAYRAGHDEPDAHALPTDVAAADKGFVRIPKDAPPLPPVSQGRTLSISGTIAIGEIGNLYKNILQAINSQKPDDLTIKLTVNARFDKDLGSAFDAALDDGWKQGKAFPNLTLVDSKKG